MTLKSACTDILMQLAEVIGQLTDDAYAQPLPVLSGNTIGKHVRHILEFYDLFICSTKTGLLNYDRRQRDLRLESDTDEALRRIGSLGLATHQLNLGQLLDLETDLSVGDGQTIVLPSSVARELLYNIEHAIHHMALIQVAVTSHFPTVDLPPHFGVAYSTVIHQAQ